MLGFWAEDAGRGVNVVILLIVYFWLEGIIERELECQKE